MFTGRDLVLFEAPQTNRSVRSLDLSIDGEDDVPSCREEVTRDNGGWSD